MTVRVRPASSADLPSLVAYEIEIARMSFGEDAVTEPAKHESRIAKGLERDSEGCLVAVDEAGDVRGWLWMAMNTNFVTGDRYANFRSLAVSPGAESTDAARALVDAGLAYARAHEVTMVTGKVNAENLPMRVLYREFGFEPTHLTMEARLDAPVQSSSSTAESEAPAVKCVVWDLDGTVWDEVAVELPEGRLPRPRADALDAMRRLSERGIVNAVASRTDPVIADVLTRLPDLDALLVAKQLAWQDKSRSLELLADDLGIAVDSLLLVDDTEFERAEVRHALPAVTTMDRDELLARLPRILPATASGEAPLRTARYRARSRRRDAAAAYRDRVDFLRSCGMRLDVGPAAESELPRVLELASRANRLSSTGLALDAPLLDGYAVDGRIVVGRLTDRFGDDGLVAIALLAPVDDSSAQARRVDLLSVSCRVAGRGAAEGFVAALGGFERAHGRALEIPVRTTGVNTELRILLRAMGFELAAQGSNRVVAALPLNQHVTAPDWIAITGATSTHPAPDAPAGPRAEPTASVPNTPDTVPGGPPGASRAVPGPLDELLAEALGLPVSQVAALPDDASLLRAPYALSSLAGARLLARIDQMFGGSLAEDDLTLQALTSLGALRAYVARRTG